jgi:hypothetical protein
MNDFWVDLNLLIKNKGFTAPFKLLFSEIYDLFWDYKFKVKTIGFGSKERSGDSHIYRPTHAKALLSLIIDLKIPQTWPVIDFGHGKGRVVLHLKSFS